MAVELLSSADWRASRNEEGSGCAFVVVIGTCFVASVSVDSEAVAATCACLTEVELATQRSG